MAQPKRRQVMVLIVGVTGSGKTTFASLASGRADLEIGYDLEPCTQDPQAVHFILDGRPVVLIDTPGFDDSIRTDVEILEDIGKWLSKQGFTKQQPLDGLILLHPITQDFKGGMEQRRTRLLEKILGKDAYKRVVVATTMWGVGVSEDGVQSDIRVRWESGIWDKFRKGGAAIIKHSNTKESAHKILQSIIDRSDEAERTGILLQQELAKEGARFTDTTLGRELETNLENEILQIQYQLLEHRNTRPPESYRKSWAKFERRMWREWEDEYNDLSKNLEVRQIQLRSLNSFVFKIFLLWARLFK